MRYIAMRPLLAVMLILGWHLQAIGEQAPQRNYAVISLIGDTLSQVYYVGVTGTHLNEGTRQRVNPIDPLLFDTEALTELGKLLRRYQPNAIFNLLSTSNPVLYQLQGKLLDADDKSREGQDYLRSILSKWKATHLILLTKQRAPADVKFTNGRDGAGWLQGLGFYVDSSLSVRNVDTGNGGQGVLVPFAYLKMQLVDASTLGVLRETTMLQSRTVGHTNAGTGISPWNELTPDEKIDSLKTLIRTGMQQGLPEVLNLPHRAEEGDAKKQ